MKKPYKYLLLCLLLAGCETTVELPAKPDAPQLGGPASLPTALSGNFTVPATVNEGSSLAISLSATGGTGGYKYSFDFNNDGTFEIVNSNVATATIPASYFPDGPNTKTIGAKITDQNDNTKTFTASVTVVNVNPTAILTTPYWGAPGSTLSFNVAPSDKGTADTAFTYLWTFGDGSTSTLKAPTHPYSTARTYSGSVKVTDKDGGSLTTAFSVIVSAIQPPMPGCTVKGAIIQTPYDNIPNFIQNPTVTSVKSGNWSDPTVWSTGIVPGSSGDTTTSSTRKISIESGHTVTYDLVISSANYINTIGIQSGGILTFKNDIDTTLYVQNFLVLEGGTLEIGTQTNPVLATKKAQVIFVDKPMDLLNDAEQYGNGLIACGTVTMYGAQKDSFVRVAASTVGSMPKKLDTTLSLQTAPVGWQANDSIVIPDTRQLHDTFTVGTTVYVPQWERFKSTISGSTVTLLPQSSGQPSALQNDHSCALDASGNVDLCPHVGNLTRNVVMRSENMNGSFRYPDPVNGNIYYTRGHVMFTMRAKIDIHYAQFGGLGRSVMPPAGTGDLTPAWDTVKNADGTFTLGTNQGHRLPVSFRHLWGPTGSSLPGGYQFIFEGNSVFCPVDPMPFVWGITVLDSHYGLIKDNVLFNWAGAGIVFHEGNESYNVVEHNFSMANRGIFTPRVPYRSGGTGASNPYYGVNYWFNGYNNYIRNNVGANASSSPQGIIAGAGFDLRWTSATSSNTPIPLYAGADMTNSSQTQKVNMQGRNILEFSGNESYGATATGLVGWYWLTAGSPNYNPNYPGVPANIIKDFTAWHFSDTGFFSYGVNNVVFDGYKLRGDTTQLRTTYAKGWTGGDYWAGDVTIQRADISGLLVGINRSSSPHGHFKIQDSDLKNNTNHITVSMYHVGGSRIPATYSELFIDNVRFSPLSTVLDSPTGNAISMDFARVYPNANWYIAPDSVYVTRFNGSSAPSADFRVFYKEQVGSYIVPQTTYYGPDANGDGIGDWGDNIGAPQSGLTNSQLSLLPLPSYINPVGVYAIAGSIAPAPGASGPGDPGAHSVPGIFGLIY